jgi:hypothetical protein
MSLVSVFLPAGPCRQVHIDVVKAIVAGSRRRRHKATVGKPAIYINQCHPGRNLPTDNIALFFEFLPLTSLSFSHPTRNTDGDTLCALEW